MTFSTHSRPPGTLITVGTASNATSVAGCIAGTIRDHGVAEVQAIGAGAVNQCIKAIAIARGYLAPMGIELVCVPSFVDLAVPAPTTEGIANEALAAINAALRHSLWLHALGIEPGAVAFHPEQPIPY